jgi:hypothetical protein
MFRRTGRSPPAGGQACCDPTGKGKGNDNKSKGNDKVAGLKAAAT